MSLLNLHGRNQTGYANCSRGILDKETNLAYLSNLREVCCRRGRTRDCVTSGLGQTDRVHYLNVNLEVILQGVTLLK